MHREMNGGKRVADASVLRKCMVAEMLHESDATLTSQTRGIKTVAPAWPVRVGHRGAKVESRELRGGDRDYR